MKDLIMAHGQHSTGPIRPACFLATNGDYVSQYHVVISPWQQGQRCLFRSLFLRGFSSNCEVPQLTVGYHQLPSTGFLPVQYWIDHLQITGYAGLTTNKHAGFTFDHTSSNEIRIDKL